MKQLLLSLFFLITISGCSTQEHSTPSISEEVSDINDTTQTEDDNLTDSTEEDNEARVSFYGVGDNLIHSEIIDYAQVEENHYDFKPIYHNLATDIQNADLSYINQETTFGGDDRGFSGYPAFSTPSDMAKNLVDLGFDIVNGSHNHTLDMGIQGLLNNLDYWSMHEDEILFTGAFESQEHRDTIPVIEVEGITFSVLTYTYGTNGITPDEPYRLNYFDPELIENDVPRAKELSDFVLVAAHWGDEHSFSPNSMQLDYAQLFADLGVDVVLGSHSHTLQPIEWVTGKDGNETLVIYSLGNLVASTVSDINLLGGAVYFDFVMTDNEQFIENIHFEPLVIHYETTVPGDISTRPNFEVFKLEDYTKDLEQAHALNGYEDNVISVERYQEIVDDVISEDYR